MSIESMANLFDIIRRLRMLAPDQVEEVNRELGGHFQDPYDLARYLVEIEWLTAHQVRGLFEGTWDELLIGPYSVLDRLGEGGVSEVFKAWDTVKGRLVALKVLRQHLADAGDAIRQFQRELQAITRLSHPNIIKTYDASQFGAVHYFAMEFVEGTDLSKHVAQVGPLPIEQACDCIRQVAQGLQHAHQLGLVHRDIKPANLYLVNPPSPTPTPGGLGVLANRRPPDPVVKILDWGLARVQLAPGEAAEGNGNLDAEKGMLIGTADYIAPEQSRDASLVDIRADIYSLGCTFYFLLTGQPPFTGKSVMQKLLQHQEAEPLPVRELRPDVPDEINAVIQKMLAKDPQDRFQIPLLVVPPLRHFCSCATSANGSLIRPSVSSSGTTLRPGLSSTGANLRPGLSGNGSTLRPGPSHR